MRLPFQKYPKYYEVIKDPIDLKTIAGRVQENLYKSMKDLEQELLLMVKNAKIFNEPKSQIYKVCEPSAIWMKTM